MQKQHKLFSNAAALLLAASLIGTSPAFAETGQRLIGLLGDITDDIQISMLDVLFLDYYLCRNPNGLRNDRTPEKCDLDGNGTVDAIDLTLLKRQIMNGETPRGIYETFEIKPIEPPISALKPSLPSVGEARILTFAVSFPDCDFDADNPAEKVQEYCFGAQNTDDPFYPMESVPAYYNRASYGKLRLQSDVFAYTAKKPLEEYTINHAKPLAEEILAAFESELDYQKYDANGDQILDSVVLMLPKDALQSDSDGDKKPDWWPFSISYSGSSTFDGITPGTYCVSTFSLDVADTNCHLVHELGHAMGLQDYYKIYQDDTYETQGLPGLAGIELMDDGCGDLSAFSKLMLGWIAEGELQVYSGGEQTFVLNSMQQTPSCLMIPRNSTDGYLSEFFLVEYITNEGNNAACFTDGYRTRYTPGSGVRILHCQAEIKEGPFGPEFRYNDRSSEYDTGNQKQRILRIVNDLDFLTYEPVTAQQPGFRWYAEDGSLSVEPELTVKKSIFYPGPAFNFDKWMEQHGLESYSDYQSDPAYLNGSRYVIRVSDSTVTKDPDPLQEEPDLNGRIIGSGNDWKEHAPGT